MRSTHDGSGVIPSSAAGLSNPWPSSLDVADLLRLISNDSNQFSEEDGHTLGRQAVMKL